MSNKVRGEGEDDFPSLNLRQLWRWRRHLPWDFLSAEASGQGETQLDWQMLSFFSILREEELKEHLFGLQLVLVISSNYKTTSY